MNEYLLEPFLARYYLLDAVLGDFLDEDAGRQMYFELAKVFCLNDIEELNAYYEESAMEPYSTVRELSSYERLCRTLEFARKNGQEICLTERDKMILAQKREAMTSKNEMMKPGKNLTAENITSLLMNTAVCGNIDAMLILSYIEYHGICICRDRENALKRMRLCAKWNDLFGNLMGIAYDTENTESYYNTLNTILKNAGQRQVFESICGYRRYTRPRKKTAVAKIIEDAFGHGIIRRKSYDRVFAKVAFSKLISAEDKEKLLLSKQKDAIAALSDLPFDASGEKVSAFDKSCSSSLTIVREGEVKKIIRNVTVADHCAPEAYSPLMIISDDDYITDMYTKMLKCGFSDTRVIEIDASMLTQQDFCGGKENIFLRGLSETKSARTVFMIKHCEAVSDENAEELIKILDYDYRKKYKLFHPPVSFDLSGLMFVLFASERCPAVRRLSERCDTVTTAPVSCDEKLSVVSCVFAARSRSFGLDGIRLEEECPQFLSHFESDQIKQIIDGALRAELSDRAGSITLEALKTAASEQDICASKRGFGYTGGDNYAKN